MSASHPQSDQHSTSSSMERWAGWIIGVAVVFFAVQRVILLGFLTSSSNAGNGLAVEVLRFLYGEPPYSILDTLLGFYVPEQGLLFLLQPHNLLLALAQAIHFGANYGLSYGLFWLIERVRRVAVH